MGQIELGRFKKGSGGDVVVKWDDHSGEIFAGPWKVHGKAKNAKDAANKAQAFLTQK